MDRRTTGIVATVATVLLCGCPGLAFLCGGAIAAFAGIVPGANIDIQGSNDPRTAMYSGLGALCLGVIFIAIPIAVGFLTLRNRPAAVPPGAPPPPPPDEPLPPAI